MPPELAELPKCPDELYYMWIWFWALVKGNDRISNMEVESWCRLYKRNLLIWEVDTIFTLDAIRIEVRNSD